MTKFYKTTRYYSNHLKGGDHFEGVSLEQELQVALNEKRPIERNAIASTFYTRKKFGVLPECDIRTDRFDLAQMAMDKLNRTAKENVAKKLEGTQVTDVPDKTAEP